MKKKYDDMIDLPRHVSKVRQRMSIENRAAQFSPFAALTGYDEAVKETSRLTDDRVELDENAMAIIDMKLNMLSDKTDELREVSITYFKTDPKKKGGTYITEVVGVKKVDSLERRLVLENDNKIFIDDILDIDIE